MAYLQANIAGTETLGAFAYQQGYTIRFTHQPTGHKVEFPATIQSFSDNHSPEFQKQYGADAMDPTIILNATDRKVSLSFNVLNSSLDEARHNRQCVNLLIQMLYPLLDSEGLIIASPYIVVEAMSLINSAVETRGIICIIDNINYSMNLDEGVINHNGEELYPISLDISIDATAVLERDANNEDTFLPRNYPSYGEM